VCGLKWSEDGQLASGGNDNKLFVFDKMNEVDPLSRLSLHLHSCTDLYTTCRLHYIDSLIMSLPSKLSLGTLINTESSLVEVEPLIRNYDFGILSLAICFKKSILVVR